MNRKKDYDITVFGKLECSFFLFVFLLDFSAEASVCSSLFPHISPLQILSHQSRKKKQRKKSQRLSAASHRRLASPPTSQPAARPQMAPPAQSKDGRCVCVYGGASGKDFVYRWPPLTATTWPAGTRIAVLDLMTSLFSPAPLNCPPELLLLPERETITKTLQCWDCGRRVRLPPSPPTTAPLTYQDPTPPPPLPPIPHSSVKERKTDTRMHCFHVSDIGSFFWGMGGIYELAGFKRAEGGGGVVMSL